MTAARAGPAFALSTLVGVVLSARVASGGPILERRWALLAELGVWSVAWAVGVAAARRLPSGLGLASILAAGVALRLAALAGPPVTSDDLYRYAWDGRVQAAGIDPYRHVPTSREVAGLRDRWLWPDGTRTRINRPTEPTIYPPGAQAWFESIHRVSGGGHRHKPWQVAGLLTELGVLGLLPVALRRFGTDARWTALYALSPAPALEIVNNGHVDGLGVLLVVAALAAWASPRRHREIRTGALLGLAAMVKLFPAVVGVALFGDRRGRALGRVVLAASAVAAVAYLPHVLDVGARVLGYLPGYLREERYDSGGRFLLASVLRLTGSPAAVASALAVGAAVAWVVARRPSVPTAAVTVLGAVLLAATPVQPWYAVTLLALATVAGRARWVAVLVAAYPYFWAVILGTDQSATVGRLCYVLALVVVGARWPSHRRRSTRLSRSAGQAGPPVSATSTPTSRTALLT